MARFGCWLVVLLVIAASLADATAQVHVRGYYRKNGTYVAPYVRSSPNSSRTDNYSSRGNYNPYTGRQGTVDPYRESQPGPYAPAVRYTPSSTYVSQPSVASITAPAPAPAQAPLVSVWQCFDSDRRSWYLAYPRAGCTEVMVRRLPATVAQTAVRPRQYFNGYPCTIDCSGHEAGYDWADENGIEDPDDCGGNSQSFVEGCRAYAEEREEEIRRQEW